MQVSKAADRLKSFVRQKEQKLYDSLDAADVDTEILENADKLRRGEELQFLDSPSPSRARLNSNMFDFSESSSETNKKRVFLKNTKLNEGPQEKLTPSPPTGRPKTARRKIVVNRRDDLRSSYEVPSIPESSSSKVGEDDDNVNILMIDDNGEQLELVGNYENYGDDFDTVPL